MEESESYIYTTEENKLILKLCFGNYHEIIFL